jgi:hypothetical protein
MLVLQLKPRALAAIARRGGHNAPDLLEYGNDYLAFIRRHPRFGSAEALIAAYQRELEHRRQEQYPGGRRQTAYSKPGLAIRRAR